MTLKMNKDPLRMAVGLEDDHVIIEFGKPIKWVGLDYETAMQLATAIFENAKLIVNKGH